MASAANDTRVQGTFDAATQESAVLLVYPSQLASGRKRPRGFVSQPRTDDVIREVASFAACAEQAQRIVERHTFQRVRHFDSQAIRQWFGCAGRAAAHMWVMRARSLHGEHGCLTRGGRGDRSGAGGSTFADHRDNHDVTEAQEQRGILSEIRFTLVVLLRDVPADMPPTSMQVVRVIAGMRAHTHACSEWPQTPGWQRCGRVRASSGELRPLQLAGRA